MRLSRTIVISTAVAACAAATVGLGTAASATGSRQLVPIAYRPISADAPFDTPVQNATCAPWPKLAPPRGTDYGHLPRWAHGRNGTVIFREDRVDLHRVTAGRHCYTNVNPRLRNYVLAPDAAVTVLAGTYYRITDREGGDVSGRYRVTRQQFLDSYNVSAHSSGGYDRYTSVYRLTFDRTGTRIVRIDEVEADWRYGACGC